MTFKAALHKADTWSLMFGGPRLSVVRDFETEAG
jgi:hypothetical protein